nr:MAG TPA: hypothetical protein [Caudoviricetes sp.]
MLQIAEYQHFMPKKFAQIEKKQYLCNVKRKDKVTFESSARKQKKLQAESCAGR